MWVKYEQAGTGYTDILLIKQDGQEEEVPLYNGTPLYYQWGRKDPMLRLNDTSTGNAVIYNASKEWRVEQVGVNASDPRISIGTSIQNPNIMYALAPTKVEVGTLRETFAVGCLSESHSLQNL